MSNSTISANFCEIGTRLSFAEKERIQPYLMKGWADHEPNHRWTVGRRAQVLLDMPDIGKKDFLLRVQCSPYFSGGRLNHQIVDVFVNGNHVDTWIVREMSWHEAIVPNQAIDNGRVLLGFVVSNPAAPLDGQSSTDPRKLGLNFRVLETVCAGRPDLGDPTLDWIGKGEDPVGDVFRKNGNYYRAIKNTAVEEVRHLIDQGVYQQLASRNLIPEHSFWDVDHPKYAMVARTHAGTFVYPPKYALLALRDAADIWLDINEFLMDVDGDYGLIDGHYGNFALFNNSRPMWVDIGSIGKKGGSLQGCPRFGLNQFIQCYVHSLLMLQHHPDTVSTRELMHAQPDGITHAQLKAALPAYVGIDEIASLTLEGDRRATLRRIRELLRSIDFASIKGGGSPFRSGRSLQWATQGKCLKDDQDPRFRAVVGLIRRSAASTFIEIGAKHGLFSILCTREGMKGIATDCQELSLNHLYRFISTRPEVQLSVTHSSFLKVPHTAELVLALAITDHLAISQGLGLDQISQSLAKNSSRVVITEFMPDGLGGAAKASDSPDSHLPSGYTLENFLSALQNCFTLVEVIDYPRPNASSRRILIYCEGPRRV